MCNVQAAVSISQGVTRHHLELVIGSNVLPYNMTVYQAVKQFSHVANTDCDTAESGCEHASDENAVWHRTHTIQYAFLSATTSAYYVFFLPNSICTRTSLCFCCFKKWETC